MMACSKGQCISFDDGIEAQGCGDRHELTLQHPRAERKVMNCAYGNASGEADVFNLGVTRYNFV